MSLLEKVNSPADLKKLSAQQLKSYSEELKSYIIDTVTKNGGHLASNLGVIDLTIALHYVFDCPSDKIIFDVGHQAYAHKIITGRREAFKSLRRDGGMTGFENMHESEYDAFSSGHSSTSLSVGLGLAKARDLAGEDYDIVTIIGDGALTGGMAYEALNQIGALHERMIIILNDNTMSISKNVGAISRHLGRLRISAKYSKIKSTLKHGIYGLPLIGQYIYRGLERIKSGFRSVVVLNKMFEQFGIRYYGVYDGHDILDMIKMLNQLKCASGPVLLHLQTNKGNGYQAAETDPEKFHGVDPVDAKPAEKFSSVFSSTIVKMAERDSKIVCVCAAMIANIGLKHFQDTFPTRCFDVGIAEQHAVTLCAGLAAGGQKPYFAVYSSFLQRGFDQLIHDVCINDLPVRFIIDRAGAIGADGVTHQGLFDLSYLSMIPNMTILAPRSGRELEKMLEWSAGFEHPLSIRYPKNYAASSHEPTEIVLGKWEQLSYSRSCVYILAVGNRMNDLAEQIDGVNIINARFVKPLDTAMLDSINKRGNLIITLEDNSAIGGFGQAVLSYLAKEPNAVVKIFAFDDRFTHSLSIEGSFVEHGITKQEIQNAIALHLAKLNA